MKFKENNQLKLIFNWFDKWNDHLLFIFIHNFLVPFIILMYLNRADNELYLSLFIILIASLIIIWLYILNFRQILEIDYEKNQILTYKQIFGMSYGRSVYDINEILFLTNNTDYLGWGGGTYKIFAETKAELKAYEDRNLDYFNYEKNFILKIRNLSKKSISFFEVYIDLINILITLNLNNKNFNIKSNLITNHEDIDQKELSFNNIKEYAKKYSNTNRFSIDIGIFLLLVWFLIIILGIILFLF